MEPWGSFKHASLTYLDPSLPGPDRTSFSRVRFLTTLLPKGEWLGSLAKEQTFICPQGSSGWADHLIDTRQISQRKQPNVIPYLWHPTRMRGSEVERVRCLSWGCLRESLQDGKKIEDN